MLLRASLSYPIVCLVWLSVFTTAMVMCGQESRALEQNMRAGDRACLEAKHRLISDYIGRSNDMLGASAIIFKESDKSNRFQCNLSFGTRNGIFASSLPPGQRQTVDRDLIKRVLREATTAPKELSGSSKTVFYAPARAADEDFCLIVEKDANHTTALAAGKGGKILFPSLLISIAISILGMILALRVVRRIQALKAKAQTMAREIADEHFENAKGNEVVNLVHVFNCMADAIKRHIAGRQEAETRLKQHRDQLEEQVIERTAHLNRLNEQLRHEINGRILTETKLLENKACLEKTLDELKQTQAAMIQSEKLASVGQLAAGVAHEINNPIGFIKSNLHTLAQYHEDIAELLRQYREFVTQIKGIVGSADASRVNSKSIAKLVLLEAELDIAFIMEDIPGLIQESNEGVERIQKIVSSLINFSQPGEKDIQPTDINGCLESTLEMIRSEHKYKVRITKNYGWVPPVRCYPQKINQVFANILANAVQAVENTGEIIISTAADEKWVTICIADTGPGISPAHLPRIFDPFFTTKEIGKAAGLGLHAARDIIQLHGGSIQVESAFGRGTTFKIRLPYLFSEDPPSQA